MIHKLTIGKLFLISISILFFSCEAHQDKKFSPIAGFEIPALIPYAKDTIKFTPPFVPPIIIDIPEEPQIENYPSKLIDTTRYVRNEPYMIVEKMPEFNGGTEAMIKYIRENLKWPQLVQEIEVQGRVILRFTVTKSGEVKNVKVLRRLAPDFDQEAVRVVKSMPLWIPGEQGGECVDVYYTIPVRFSLTNE